MDCNGFTPLFLACKQGHEEVVELLLKANADPNAPCNPIQFATNAGHHRIVNLLKEYSNRNKRQRIM
jgi:ankyrin repeat protein